MNRKQFILSHGATCNNWTWSWSFVNHEKKMVIFGAWDVESDKERDVILKEDWELSAKKKATRIHQALEHISYIERGYELLPFGFFREDNPDVAVIEDFERKLKKDICVKKMVYGMRISLKAIFQMKSISGNIH
jgi:5-methylcytosine-specific restriction protein A